MPSRRSSRSEASAGEFLLEIIPVLASRAELDQKLTVVANLLCSRADYDAAEILVRGQDGRTLSHAVFSDVPPQVSGSWVSLINRRERLEALDAFRLSSKPILYADVEDHPLVDEDMRQILRAGGIRSALSLPLIWEGTVTGAFTVGSRRLAAFGPKDIEFLSAVATPVSSVLRLASLVQELAVTNSRISRLQEDAVIMLAQAAEIHDPATGFHLQSIRLLSRQLALELGYSEEEAQDVSLGAVLHDIGKLQVPMSVLAKSSSLSDEEWEVVKRHTTAGADLLSGRESMDLAAHIARWHHERWDGGGYPDGLAGERIPQAVAIVTVADSFDAITSDRPYRRARSTAAAVREIAAGSGSQFSPEVVAALLRLHRRGILNQRWVAAA